MTDLVEHEGWESVESMLGISAQHMAELRALPAAQIVSINVNVPETVAKVLAIAAAVRLLRPAIQQAITDVNLEWIDGLEDYAQLLNALHGALLAAPKPRCAIGAAPEARKVRRRLKRGLQSLVELGLIPRDSCPEFSGSNGHIELATDLMLLDKFLRLHRASPRAQGIVPLDDLNLARELSQRVLRGRQVRSISEVPRKVLLDLRARAFTLLARAYAEARFAVLYVRRHHGDADTLIPSLFSHKRKRRQSRRKGLVQHGASRGETPEDAASPAFIPDTVIEHR